MSALSDFLTSDTAPWWTSLAGVVVGGALGGWLTHFTSKKADERKFAREDRQQWDKELRDLTVRMLESGRKALDLHPSGSDSQEDRDQKLKLLNEEYELQRTVKAHLKLMAPQAVFKAAQAFGDISMNRLRAGGVTSPTRVDFYAARKALTAEVRVALRVQPEQED